MYAQKVLSDDNSLRSLRHVRHPLYLHPLRCQICGQITMNPNVKFIGEAKISVD